MSIVQIERLLRCSTMASILLVVWSAISQKTSVQSKGNHLDPTTLLQQTLQKQKQFEQDNGAFTHRLENLGLANDSCDALTSSTFSIEETESGVDAIHSVDEHHPHYCQHIFATRLNNRSFLLIELREIQPDGVDVSRVSIDLEGKLSLGQAQQNPSIGSIREETLSL